MATIDPRLLSLIDTLISSGADWLAFEILDEVRAGKPTIQNPEDSEGAHGAMRTLRMDESRRPEPKLRETAMEPITGDEQIEFAAAYVVGRISQIIEMAGASLKSLDQIAAHSESRSLEARVGDDANVVLGLEGSDLKLNTVQVEEALQSLPKLQSALLGWSLNVRQKERES